MIYPSLLTILTVATLATAAPTKRQAAASSAKTCEPVCAPGVQLPCVATYHGRQPADFGKAIIMPVAPGPNEGFVVLSSTGVSNVPKISINGNVGVAPAALTYITAFALVDHGNYAESYMVNSNGKVYGADTAGSQTPLAVNYMVTAYNDAAQITADYIECGAGSLDSLIIKKGVYHWSTAVSLSLGAKVTLSGVAGDYFILQADGAFSLLGEVVLDGIKPDQVFWVGATSLTVGDHAYFRGTALTYTNIVIADFAQVYGRLWTQTEVAFAAGSMIYAPTFESGVPDDNTPTTAPSNAPTAVTVAGFAVANAQKAADTASGTPNADNANTALANALALLTSEVAKALAASKLADITPK